MSPSLLSGVVNDLDTPVLLHHPKTGEVLDANPAVENLYGYSPGELTQLSVEEFSSESDRYSQQRAERAIVDAAEGEEQAFEWQIRTKYGELRWVKVRLRDVTIDGEQYVLAENHDVTEAKNRSRRLRLLYRVIRHNLRNDMTVILGHTDSICRELTDEQRRERLAAIRETAKEVGQMTDSVRDIVEVATNDEVQSSPTNVPDLLSEIIDDIESSYPGATVELSVASPAAVVADGSLRAALSEAIENAVEHSQQADPVARVRVDASPAERTVTVQVVDQCPRIPQMELDALAAQADTDGTNHGTGVGLFVMKWCTESLGGDLEVRRTETDGNLVEFTFPMYRESREDSESVAV